MKCYVLPIKQRCNATCWFCSTDQYAPASAVETLATGPDYTTSLRWLVAQGVTRFEFTGGGEPTLNKSLPALIEEVLSERGDASIKLYTNGLLLRELPKIQQINISRVHIDDKLNSGEMGFPARFPSLVQMLNFYRPFCDELRLSIVSMKGAIDSHEALIEQLAQVGAPIDSVVVRPLYPMTPERDERLVSIQPKPTRDSTSFDIEFDIDACTDGDMLILGADGSVYLDWSLTKPLFRPATANADSAR